ncbi:PREDICTED: zinc finger CCHC domain-containing protein 8-like isoform X1 [Camelina sativa]|uniref:Zinc finger CCHC domain-containing protein 8-like isoform X1 n=1 Tax=Camelina sativa TaxID=90675 RepID=A0ABM0U4P9_CAMSA|nr:PREDICTED: zinc finger CCHC domain-containing protein 8-like isoform X1 [Camelina sativa]XP_010435769.1 PREDICTED: zinc finger CCHC domain-containing protein 8-like isoform X1 [Camelina sativa]XP_010435770.1 PREDICTED: zinc finger CCHC domain-containing protein 8-like isoform X1 [Camelina sativa]
MEAEDGLDLPASSSFGSEVQKSSIESGNRSPEANPIVGNDENVKRNLDMETDLDPMEENLRTVGGQEFGEILTEQVGDGVNVSVECLVVDENVGIQKETLIRSATLDVSSAKSGVKRPRTSSDEQQPNVHVTYKHLTRASKQKLESLLQQWSEWEAEYTSLAQNQEQPLESGEETYFPALRVGLQKTSSVSFWIDNQTGPKPLEEFVLVESSTTPLYDRKFAIGLNSADGSRNLEGGLEIIDDDPPRCFNCGGYSHSLRECPKPFDRLAVNSARKLQKSKRNQSSSGPRLPSRYYQKPQTGKYDGLKPGTLDAETRQLLNLGELDPPPWFNRMREIGYPPGYLAPGDDHLSGITIFGEEVETREEIESEDGEILEKAPPPEPEMKKTVEFPGINAPLPENADEWLWEAAPSQKNNSRSGRWQQRTSRGHDYRDDGPLGVESSSYPARYGSRYNYGYGSKDYSSRSRSPGLDRSVSERSKRDYSFYDADFRERDRDRDRDRNRDRNRDWDKDKEMDRDRDRDRDDRDWSYRLSSRR